MGSCCAEVVVRVNHGGSSVAEDGVIDGGQTESLKELTDVGGEVAQIRIILHWIYAVVQILVS